MPLLANPTDGPRTLRCLALQTARSPHSGAAQAARCPHKTTSRNRTAHAVPPTKRAIRVAIHNLIFTAVIFGFHSNASAQPVQIPSHPNTNAAIVLRSAIVKTAPPVQVPGLSAGSLTRLSIREGDRVTRGQFLAQVDSTEFELELEQAQLDHQLATMTAENTTDLQYFKKSLVVATAEYERSVAANQRVENSVPISKLEKQRLEKERAELQVQQATRQLEIAAFRTRLSQSKIKNAQMKIERTKIIAPNDGIVVAVGKQTGEWTQQSETVCEIVSTGRLRVEGMATAEQASQIKIGDQARVTFRQPWLAQKEFNAVVTFVSPAANPVNLLVPVWVELENPSNQIMAGMNGEIAIRRGESLKQ